MHNPWVLEIEEVGNWTSQSFSGDPPCNLPEQPRAGLKAVGNVSKPVEPSSGHSSTLNKQLNSLSLFSLFFLVLFALLLCLWIWAKGFWTWKYWYKCVVCFRFVFSLEHRLQHPKGRAQLWLNNWVSLFLVGLCAQTTPTVIILLNLFKQFCTNLLNVNSFLRPHFLKKKLP